MERWWEGIRVREPSESCRRSNLLPRSDLVLNAITPPRRHCASLERLISAAENCSRHPHPRAMGTPQATDESRVLILNTGGTINMILGHRGYVPEPYFLTESLRTQNRFHDPLEDSLFSHSSSVEGYREWTSNSSGRASPVAKPGTPDAAQANQHHPTLPVRSSRPMGISQVTANLAAGGLRSNHPKPPVSNRISEDLYEAHLPSLITPRSAAPGGMQKRIRYAVLEGCCNSPVS